MDINNKFPKDKDFFLKIYSNNNIIKDNWKHNSIISNFILNLDDGEFWNLINVRLCLPSTQLEIKRALNDTDIKYWTTGHLIEKLFLQIAKTREIINYKDKQITIYKYYHQALRLWKWIPISKPKAKFTIYITDLTPRIFCELRNLDKYTAQYVLKECVKRIFENIDFKFYHEHIENNLEVILED